MTTIAHSTLTGTDLHESKGAAAATAGQVAIANGSGNAVFGLLTASSLTGSGNSFGAQLLHVQEQQASGTGTTTATTTGSFITTVLNTVLTNEISGASLSSNTIILPAGTYFIQAHCPWVFNTSTSSWFVKPRLFNNTVSTTLLSGIAMVSLGAAAGGGIAVLSGRFTLAGTSTLILQTYKNIGTNGSATSTGAAEVYAEALIWKIA